MAEGNGDGVPLFVMGKRGRLRVQYDTDTPEVTLDVMLVQDQWREIDATFRDDKTKEIPPEKLGAYYGRSVAFVEELLQLKAGTLSWAEAEHFMVEVTKRCKELKAFFESVSGSAPSSRASTELIFSEGPVDLD